MKYDVVLKKLENNEITSKEALQELYPVKKQKIGKRATFIKMKISVPEEGKGINTFLKILFALPFPMIFARMGLRIGGRFVKDMGDVKISEITRLLKYSKNTIIDVDSHDAQIQIRVI